ncbi:25656_t:CDS:1, partial [Racocetra persica]
GKRILYSKKTLLSVIKVCCTSLRNYKTIIRTSIFGVDVLNACIK